MRTTVLLIAAFTAGVVEGQAPSVRDDQCGVTEVMFVEAETAEIMGYLSRERTRRHRSPYRHE